MRHLRTPSFFLCLSALLPQAALAQSADPQPECAGQDVSDRQSNGAFNSIVDGQPPSPDQPQFSAVTSYDRASDTLLGQVAFGITPEIGGKFCQTQISVTLPAYDIGRTNFAYPSIMEVTWEQRWRIADTRGPTLSTNISFNIPLESGAGGTSMTVTGIVAENTKNGVLYLNGTIESEPDLSWSNPTWNALVGYKHIIHEGLEFYGDVIYAEGDVVTGEISAEIDLSDGWSIGPGIALSTDLSGAAPSDLVVGVALARGF